MLVPPLLGAGEAVQDLWGEGGLRRLGAADGPQRALAAPRRELRIGRLRRQAGVAPDAAFCAAAAAAHGLGAAAAAAATAEGSHSQAADGKLGPPLRQLGAACERRARGAEVSGPPRRGRAGPRAGGAGRTPAAAGGLRGGDHGGGLGGPQDERALQVGGQPALGV